MRVLGIETSCDETGVALYCTERGLLAQALHSQVEMHRHYGGVVPELASRDHVRRLVPLIEKTLADGGVALADIDAIGVTEGPGLAGALLVGVGCAKAIGYALGKPVLGVHHLEGHLLSPLLGADPPAFPFVALLVSGGHTQLLDVQGLGRYRLLGDTVDDAAGEAFDKSAKLMDLGYPGGPALSALAATWRGVDTGFRLPRPKLRDPDLDFSFSGLKTAVLTAIRKGVHADARAALAHEIEQAITDVLAGKALRALGQTGHARLVVSGGVSANRELRRKLAAAGGSVRAYFPELALCTDNGAMIAYAAALRLDAMARRGATLDAASRLSFDVQPRWPLASLQPP